MPNREIIIGPPGTGKTTKLLDIVETALANGIKPNEIAFLTFTNKAANEAIDRAIVKFKLKRHAFPFFQTIHSFAFHQLGLQLSQVFSPNSDMYKEFAKLMGLTVTYGSLGQRLRLDQEAWIASTNDDKLLMCQEMAKVKMIPLKDQWSLYKASLNWFELERVATGLDKYKKAKGLYDFTDMILECTKKDVPLPKLKLLVIDEAQDLSKVQWLLIERLITHSDKTYIAGDDDQAIFNWSGADADYFIDMIGKVTVLNQSYRVPRKVQTLANRIIAPVKHRREKIWQAADRRGSIVSYNSFEYIDYTKGKWLILARNTYFLHKIAKHLKQEGLFYSFRDKPSLDISLYNSARAWEEMRKGKDIPVDLVKDLLKLVKRGDKITFNKELEFINFNTFKASFQLINLFSLPWYEAFNNVSPYDIEYIRSMLRHGEQFQNKKTPARIILSTIHGAKGGECENVVLVTDVSLAVYENLRLNADDELRTLYTAITRTSEKLCLLAPETDYYYEVL